MSQVVFDDIDATITTGLDLAGILNNFRDAVLSNYSGTSEPPTMWAYQWWADTTAGILKLRNAANDGWISILSLSTGGSNPSYKTPTNISTTYTALATDTLLVCAAGTYTVTLPVATASTGKILTVLKAGATGILTIDGNGADTINGQANMTLENQYSSAELYCNGTEWFLVG